MVDVLQLLKDVLSDVSKDEELQFHDCLVVVLMGHGKTEQGQAKLLAFDGQLVDIGELMSLFNNKNCPSLRGKVKIFLIQCCRGGKYSQLATHSRHTTTMNVFSNR